MIHILYTFQYIYISDRNSVSSFYSSSYNRKKNTIFNTLEQQIYRTSFLPSFQKKKSSFKSSIHFPFFSTNYSVLSRFKWETDSLGLGGARMEGKRERKKERKKKGDGDRIETESETMYIQAVRSRSSKRLTTGREKCRTKR